MEMSILIAMIPLSLGMMISIVIDDTSYYDDINCYDDIGDGDLDANVNRRWFHQFQL